MDDKDPGLSNEEGNGVLMVNTFPDVIKINMHIFWLIDIMFVGYIVVESNYSKSIKSACPKYR